MKRNIHLLGFLLLVVILAGCSIPFGDKASDINESETEENNQEKDLANENSVTEIQDDESAENDQNNESHDVSTNNENSEDNDSASNENATCEEGDLSDVTDELIPGFHMPDCTSIASVSKSSSSMKAHLHVDGADWQKVHEEYKEYFGDLLENEQKKNQEEFSEINAHVYETNENTRLRIRQKEDYVDIELAQDFPE